MEKSYDEFLDQLIILSSLYSFHNDSFDFILTKDKFKTLNTYYDIEESLDDIELKKHFLKLKSSPLESNAVNVARKITNEMGIPDWDNKFPWTN